MTEPVSAGAGSPPPPRRGRRVALVLILVLALLAGLGVVFRDRIVGLLSSDQPDLMAAIPYWDQPDAVASLGQHPGHVTVASPWSYGIDRDGDPVLQEGLTVKSEARLTEKLKSLGLQVVPTIANTTKGLWDEQNISQIMSDPGRRAEHVAGLRQFVQEHDYDGIQLDYENLAARDRDGFTATVRQLAAALHEDDKKLWITVHAKETDAGYDARNLAQDYRDLGAAADHVVLMAYDWHWETSPPGPIAPIDWVERVVRYAVTEIPREKIILGMGLFGYDWGDGDSARIVTWGEITERARVHPVDEQWDVGSQSPHFSYSAEGSTHQVWYENGRSVDLKVRLATANRLGGAALWRLGREDPSIWDAFGDAWNS